MTPRAAHRVRLRSVPALRRVLRLGLTLVVALGTASTALRQPAAAAGPPRVLPPGRVPADARLGPLKGEQGDFSFAPATSPEQWERRARYVRRLMRVALGLWPMPTKTPLAPVIHGKVERDDYTVEKVYFESLPGLFISGNLYRPKGTRGKRPGVLSPHGHFPGGRFQDAGREAVRRQIVQGAERFEEGGRSFMQSRCVQLARMGCVVFHYDMIGYGDSEQIPMDVVHRFSAARAKISRPPPEGFYSAAAELNLQNPMGLHTYHSIRALDFLAGLPDVDSGRIAVTGASGGGTQTFMLCAVDDRPLVSVPAVIVSTTRQGGCTCENISGLRIGTTNLEFTALHAPKPLLLISADDATRTMGQHGFPELKRHYEVLGAPANVSHTALLHFPHNFNYVSRAAMVHWLNRHLELGLAEPIVEGPYERLTQEELSVWDEDHPRPKGGSELEQKVLQWLRKDASQQMAKVLPRDERSLGRYRSLVGGGWDALVRPPAFDAGQRGPSDASTRAADFQMVRSASRGRYEETLGLLRYRTVEGDRAELPIAMLSPKNPRPRAVVWIDEAGKSGLYEASGSPKAAIERLLAAGVTVVGVDLLYQGEFLSDGRPPTRARSLPGEETFAGWTYCYNLPLLARRVGDLLAVVEWLGRGGSKPRQVDMVGLGSAGPPAAVATALARGSVARAAIDTGGFRFSRLKDVYDVNFLPGAVKYGDLPGALALAAPNRLWLAGEGKDGPSIVRAAYRAAGKPENLSVFSAKAPRTPEATPEAAVDWLLEE